MARAMMDGRALPDHALLVASAAVRQASTRTAQAASRLMVAESSSDPVTALVRVFRHGDAGTAARALGGSFHPPVAAATVPASSTNMKPAFTLAF